MSIDVANPRSSLIRIALSAMKNEPVFRRA